MVPFNSFSKKNYYFTCSAYSKEFFFSFIRLEFEKPKLFTQKYQFNIIYFLIEHKSEINFREINKNNIMAG
jgi:hypothetical protein